MIWPLIAGMAALGAIQGEQQRAAQRRANQQQAAITAAQTEFSPWTKIQPQQFSPKPEGSGWFGGAAQGALGGAMFSQGLEDQQKLKEQELQDEFNKMQVNPLDQNGVAPRTMSWSQNMRRPARFGMMA